MQTNNALYAVAVEHVIQNNIQPLYSLDSQILREKGYVVSKIEIDDDLPNTPVETGFVENTEIPKASTNLLSYCISLDIYPVVYEGENEGKLIRHVVPRKGKEDQISSYGSNQTFFPHVDNPDLRLREEEQFNNVGTYVPDTLTLLCLRQQEGVATSIVLLDDVLADLTEEEKEQLQESVFTIARPASFEGSSACANVPLLRKLSDGSYVSRFDFHNISTSSKIHQPILEKFKKSAIDENKWISLYLEPGQAVTFDNQKTLHTRNGFKAKFDGKDRWLLRVFGSYEKPQQDYFVSSDCHHHLKTA